jgi:hypothetical protein
MISLLTNIVLDATVGVVWWITKTSYYGITYSVGYFFNTDDDSYTKDRKDIMLLEDYLTKNKEESKQFFISDLNSLIDEKNNKIDTLEKKIKLLESSH